MTPSTSRQPRTRQTRDVGQLVWTLFERAADEFPVWGSAGRTEALRVLTREEPILSGAVASMCSKMVSLDWEVSGGRTRVRRFHPVLAAGEDGGGWSYLLDRWVQDYLVTDIGGVIELGREEPEGPVAGLYNMDSARLALTGNVLKPLRYAPVQGREVPLNPGDFTRIVDQPSTSEQHHGLGFSAVSRAVKAARVLVALYRYEEEHLADLPPQGIVSLTGVTMPEVQAAFDLYDAARAMKKQTVFKNILWFASQTASLGQIKVDVTPFSTLPEHFNKEQAIQTYVATLALDFGTDVREFWPFSQGPLGSGKEAEIQAQKAAGKGFGRAIMSIERAINWDVLPEGLEFRFIHQDSADDLQREQIRGMAIANVRRLWEPTMEAGGLLTTEEARRWLVELDAVPGWVAETSEATAIGSVTGIELEEKAARARLQRGEDYVSVNGRGETTVLWSPTRVIPVLGWPIRDSSPFGVRQLEPATH